jgi:hypothetical protein
LFGVLFLAVLGRPGGILGSMQEHAEKRVTWGEIETYLKLKARLWETIASRTGEVERRGIAVGGRCSGW